MKVIFENPITGDQILIDDEPVQFEDLERENIVSPNNYPYKPTVIVRFEQNGIVTRWAEDQQGRFEYTGEFLKRRLHKWFYKHSNTGVVVAALYREIYG